MTDNNNVFRLLKGRRKLLIILTGSENMHNNETFDGFLMFRKQKA